MVLNHLDVYRFDRVEEAQDLALPEILDEGVTLVEWAPRWSASASGRPSTRARDQSYLRTHVLPAFGDRESQIDRGDDRKFQPEVIHDETGNE